MKSHTSKIKWFVLLLIVQVNFLSAQTNTYVYHTPTGTRYHTSKCHMVDNTSNSILLTEALERDMMPCTYCKPDINITTVGPEPIGPVIKPGQKDVASQCTGKTQEGVRCKRQTKNANGYCFQHLAQTKT